ncbi:hypothetical protein NE237_000331 [Protea cynaroides]|uniref:Uncharacterized protein n=1 Tax=Protea cynaroides TaxID=273540 RepID=A0A9Q0QXD6_9MAGN|nr:hypothetical protein NE237_000331 [Protea cynaroides]
MVPRWKTRFKSQCRCPPGTSLPPQQCDLDLVCIGWTEVVLDGGARLGGTEGKRGREELRGLGGGAGKESPSGEGDGMVTSGGREAMASLVGTGEECATVETEARL